MTRTNLSAALTRVPLILALTGGTPLAIAAEDRGADRTTAEDVQEELADAGAAIAEYSADQRDEAVAQAESALRELDARIERTQAWVDEHWDELSQAAREKTRETMAELREDRNQVAEWLGGLKHSSEEAWAEVKEGFANAYTQLQEAWGEAEEELDAGADAGSEAPAGG